MDSKMIDDFYGKIWTKQHAHSATSAFVQMLYTWQAEFICCQDLAWTEFRAYTAPLAPLPVNKDCCHGTCLFTGLVQHEVCGFEFNWSGHARPVAPG